MTLEAEIFSDREALLEAHPSAQWHEYGPIHKHDGKLFVQVYLGQHEWIAISVEDTSERYLDPGWEGTEFGWGFVPEGDHFQYPDGEDISAPEREGKPITVDQFLFADRDKLEAYLGKDDPLLKEE